MNITQKRVQYLKKLKGDFYKGLQTAGPKGGQNAKVIEGWSCTPSSGWTQAAHIAGYWSMPWWHGSAPTPSRAFPEKLVVLMDDSKI